MATRKVRRPNRKGRKSASGSKDTYDVEIPTEPNVPPTDFSEYCTLIFGAKGAGKTSLCAQLPGSLTIQLEPRRRNLRIRQIEIPPVTISELRESPSQVTPWQKIQAVIDKAITDKSVKHICIDTVDRAYDAAFNHHCAKNNVDNPSDLNDYGKTWDKIKQDFERTLSLVHFTENPHKGLILTSHSRHREVAEDDEAPEMFVPTCKPACWQFLKACCDYAFYYGFSGNRRVLVLRGNEEIWTACGPEDFFLDPDGNPLQRISMGTSPKEAYTNLLRAFANKIRDLDYVAPSTGKTRKRKRG